MSCMSGQWLRLGVFYILALSGWHSRLPVYRPEQSKHIAFSTFNSVCTAKWKRDSSWKSGPWCPAHRAQLSYLPRSCSLNRHVHPATWPGLYGEQMGGPDTKGSECGNRLPCHHQNSQKASPTSCPSIKWIGLVYFSPRCSALLWHISSSKLHET